MPLTIQVKRTFTARGVAAILAYEKICLGRHFPTSRESLIRRVRSFVQSYGESLDKDLYDGSHGFDPEALAVVSALFPEWRKECR